ncbi:hypothetical protein EDB81DRAFT_772208 [Dactylonectria macrodidyma]|uniref:Secreted protein n=1 Tax=Dactylonectria macrodidyma TaxID=307937 RepID=A0A9P9FU37_9HYPO|nr:hypothetical protein EDB81DRAFT_772208 [Dactylonectria macrodidyma]
MLRLERSPMLCLLLFVSVQWPVKITECRREVPSMGVSNLQSPLDHERRSALASYPAFEDCRTSSDARTLG